MFSNNIPKDNIEKTVAVFGADSDFDGTLKFSKSLRIFGKFHGTIESTGFLEVAAGASIDANIVAKSAVIRGSVVGNIEVSDRLEMVGGACVCGDVKAASLRIADGAQFDGKCTMVKSEHNVDLFASSRESLKKFLQA